MGIFSGAELFMGKKVNERYICPIQQPFHGGGVPDAIRQAQSCKKQATTMELDGMQHETHTSCLRTMPNMNKQLPEPLMHPLLPQQLYNLYFAKYSEFL